MAKLNLGPPILIEHTKYPGQFVIGNLCILNYSLAD
jgi:hypothetical protein